LDFLLDFVRTDVGTEESFEFSFEWDAAKAAGNRRKHGVSFNSVVGVRDPLMISIP